MKLDIPVPLQKLQWFQEKLGLTEHSFRPVESYRDHFVKKKGEFSHGLFRYFNDIPETRILLDRVHGISNNGLIAIWERWFEMLFREAVSIRLLTYLWRSGLRHVEADIDQRFINLGYAFVRQFCHGVAEVEVPSKDRQAVLLGANKLIDFCVLIETHAFITATSQCDMEVVRGISHQVRNPLTVIGGHILRLKRNTEPGSRLEEIYDVILNENRRLEKMVVDVGVYSDMLEREPRLQEAFLKDLIADAMDRLKSEAPGVQSAVHVLLDPESAKVVGDARDLTTMFYYLLQNSLEAVDAEKDVIGIGSMSHSAGSRFLEIEISNRGRIPKDNEIPNLFVPFYSSKPLGTGLGLPIARLAARKSQGDVLLDSKPAEGVRCTIRLPLPPE
jgi:signal transduction histidine kinase